MKNIRQIVIGSLNNLEYNSGAWDVSKGIEIPKSLIDYMLSYQGCSKSEIAEELRLLEGHGVVKMNSNFMESKEPVAGFLYGWIDSSKLPEKE